MNIGCVGIRPRFPKKIQACLRYTDDNIAQGGTCLHQTSIRGVFPNWQPRAGCAPCLHRFLIGTILMCHPFQQIEYQAFSGLGHAHSIARCRYTDITSPEHLAIIGRALHALGHTQHPCSYVQAAFCDSRGRDRLSLAATSPASCWREAMPSFQYRIHKG